MCAVFLFSIVQIDNANIIINNLYINIFTRKLLHSSSEPKWKGYINYNRVYEAYSEVSVLSIFFVMVATWQCSLTAPLCKETNQKTDNTIGYTLLVCNTL